MTHSLIDVVKMGAKCFAYWEIPHAAKKVYGLTDDDVETVRHMRGLGCNNVEIARHLTGKVFKQCGQPYTFRRLRDLVANVDRTQSFY